MRPDGLDVLACPRCRERLSFVEVVHDRERVRALLEGLGFWTEQLPCARLTRPARDMDFI